MKTNTVSTYKSTKTSHYKKMMDLLDSDQKQAVTAPDGIVRVNAGAGTGKTTVLTARIAWLVTEKGVDPQQIVATTFTKKAAAEIKERLLVYGPEMALVTVGTLHSVALKLLREFWEEAELQSRDFLIADTSDVVKIVDSSVVPVLEKAGAHIQVLDVGDNNPVEILAHNIIKTKEHGETIASLAEKLKKINKNKTEDIYFIKAFLEYHRQLNIQNIVDLPGIIEMVRWLLRKDERVAALVSARTRYLLVDEFQDTSPAQIDLVASMSAYHGNLMIVGDDDQSMYSFRGSSGASMTDITGFIKAPIIDIGLATNRRCTAEILEPANHILRWNENHKNNPKQLRSTKHGNKVAGCNFSSEKKEAEWIADEIANLIAHGESPESIAVLYRLNALSEPLQNALIKRKIKFATRDNWFFNRPEIKDIIAYLKLAVAPGFVDAFERISSRPTRGLGPSIIEKIIDNIVFGDSDVIKSCYRLASLKGITPIAAAGAYQLAEALTKMSALIDEGASIVSIINFILADDGVGYMAWVQTHEKKNEKKIKSSIAILYEIASHYKNFYDFMDEIALLSEEGVIENNAVIIGTIHSAKGLEWNHVFLPCWERDLFPHRIATSVQDDTIDIFKYKKGGITEERKIAHVALTRARTQAYPSYSSIRGRGRGKKESHASSFFAEASIKIKIINKDLEIINKGSTSSYVVKKQRFI